MKEMWQDIAGGSSDRSREQNLELELGKGMYVSSSSPRRRHHSGLECARKIGGNACENMKVHLTDLH